MKVILMKDLEKIGQKGEIVEVKDGYARNFLLPKEYAVEATNKNLNRLKNKLAAIQKQNEEELQAAQEIANKIESIQVDVKLKVGEGGKTFGSISTKEVADVLKSEFKLDVDRKKLQLENPIKSIGTHAVNVKLHPEVTAELKVVVSEE